jgi:hypothetical protein
MTLGMRERSVRQLARKLSGPEANHEHASIEDTLEELLKQNDEPTPKAKKPAKKRSPAVKKTLPSKSRSKASRTAAASSVQDAPSLESPDDRPRKRKASGADAEAPPSKRTTAQDLDQRSVASDLSELGATPERPGLFGDESLDDQSILPNNALPDIGPAPDVSSSLADQVVDSPASPLPATSIVATVEDAERQTLSDPVAELATATDSTSAAPADALPAVCLKLPPPLLLAVSQSVPSPDQALDSQDASDPAATLPTPTSVRQRPRRTINQPASFRGLEGTLSESIQGDSVDNEDDIDPAGDSPTVRKAARKSPAKAKTKPRTKAAISSEKVTEDDLADDVKGPTTSKAPRKRKAATTDDNLANDVSGPPITKAPRKRKAATTQHTPLPAPVSSGKATEDDPAKDITAPAVTKAPRKRKAPPTEPTPRKKPAIPKTKVAKVAPKTPAAVLAENSEALFGLPSPSSSQSDLAAEFSIDADLLKLSRAMTHREPLTSKLDPVGKPEVWAPGRQELCETLPYFKSAHSGCYANDGTIYSFMFDSAGVGREYMDSDVVVARMGGNMTTDIKTGVMYQTKDHLMKDKQPQSLLNNIAHKNPLVIVCGDKNEGAITKMPHRYCVLDWFKPTHVWGEKTMGKKEPRTSIRYRFERLDRSKQSWYTPTTPPAGTASEYQSPTESGSSTELVPAESESSTNSSSLAELSLPVQTCTACSKSCPQIYLIDWLCTDTDCTAFWKLPNGQDAPYGKLDYHPAFLQHRTGWEREDPPFSLNPGVPQVDQHFGDSLSYVSTRGVVCPDCGRCNMRYLFTHWRCDTIGCKWKLIPEVRVVMPSNLSHTPWDMTSDGPSLAKAVVKPVVHTQVKYLSNYKVIKYTIEGVIGSVVLAKANKHVVSEPGGADDMFRELQMSPVGLERRILRKTADTEQKPSQQQKAVEPDDAAADDDEDKDDDQPGEAGARMTAFGMNFGMPYKFIATGDSKSFEDAPAAVRAVRTRLNWAQRAFVNDESGYQDFNEELIFAYLEGQKIKYHDDGEEGLGPRIATLSLGAPATMNLRLKAKYFSHVSKTGVFTDEKPLPLPLLESCGWASGYTTKAKDPALQASKTVSRDTHAARLAAWDELQDLRAKGDMKNFRIRSKELPTEFQMKHKEADTLLSFHLTHGDIAIMEGEDIQKFLEHSVEPHGHLRFAMTCRTILPGHLPLDQMPPYEVLADQGGYDGAGIREERDGGREAVVWE